MERPVSKGRSRRSGKISRTENNENQFQVEEEIQTLRHVLANKIKVSQDLKRKLGISVWKELTDDVNQGLKNVKESHVYVSCCLFAFLACLFIYVHIFCTYIHTYIHTLYTYSMHSAIFYEGEVDK